MGRIKVSIPSINPDEVFDDWVIPIASHCLGNGFGMLMIPPIGSEVIISGVLGQVSNLVYHAAIYNEDNLAPEDLTPETAGIVAPAKLLFKANDVELYATELLKETAEDIEITATATNAITGEQLELTAGDKITAAGNEIEIVADGPARLEADGAAALIGNSVTIHADGSITIQANGNIAISATGNLTLQGRTVNKVGPPI